MDYLAALGKPCRILPALMALGTFAWVAGAGSATAQDQSPLAKRLFAEAPRAWSRQQQFFLTLQGSNNGERRVLYDGKWTNQPGKTFFKQYDGNMLTESANFESGSWKGIVEGVNSQYVFMLARDSDTKPWVITKVDKRGEEWQNVWNSRTKIFPDLLIAPRTPPLHEIFQSKKFRCISVEPERTNDEDLVRLTFTFSPEGSVRLKGGWLVLDPAHFWVIRKGETEQDLGEKNEGTAKWTVQYDYKEGSRNHPIITKTVMKGKFWQKGQVIAEQLFTGNYDLQERASIPESEFTLTAYGLPEPHWARPKKTISSLWRWLGIAGIACLVLGAGVFWFKRRRAAGGL